MQYLLVCAIIFILKLHTVTVNGANILGAFFVPSISHQVVFQPIWRELSLRGHQVTVLTPNPLNDPTLTNLTEIDLGFAYDLMKAGKLQGSAKKDNPIESIVYFVYEFFGNIVKTELEHPAVQALIQDQSKHFDLVMVEYMHPTFAALSARFKCPWVGITSLGALLPVHDSVGNPTHPILNPDVLLPFTGSLSFSDRILSVYYSIWFRYYYYYHVLPDQDKVVQKYIGEGLPSLREIEKNISLLFVNVNPIIHPIRPNLPTVIELGKMHIKPKKPLPKDLQQYLDKSTEGVVYFSLGSNVRSANLSIDLRKKVMKALSELPYKVLWKWEDDQLPDQPKNVLTRKWFPQQDVLAHSNVKAFVTQGGLQSMEEAITGGVPLVGMPFFGDQPLNCKKIVNLGMGKALDTDTLTSEELKNTIIEVAENSKYRERIKEIRNLLSDVPSTGLEKAVWWIEYVIRHKGASHLRSPAIDLPLYQYFLLDVIGLAIIVVFIIIFVLYNVFKFIFGGNNYNKAKQKVL